LDDKLLELKEQFCRWYCPNRGEEISYECSGIVECKECNEEIECNAVQEIYVNLCSECQVLEYIRFIRDELK
jgi:hypothetical protein